jgi:DNA-binding Lrp family transcriptional regulator
VLRPVDDLEKEVLRKVKLVGEAFMIIRGVGGVAVVGLAVKGELENKVAILRRLLEPSIANIFPVCSSPAERFTRTDLLLIRHLIRYPKTPVKDIARAIRASTRTVKRRLDALTKSEVLRFMILFDPVAMKGFIHFSMILNVDPKKYRNVAGRIYRDLSANFLIPPPPIYQESAIVVILYADNVYLMDEMFDRVRRLDGVHNAELFIPSKIEFVQDWFVNALDNLLRRSRETKVVRREEYAAENVIVK